MATRPYLNSQQSNAELGAEPVIQCGQGSFFPCAENVSLGTGSDMYASLF